MFCGTPPPRPKGGRALQSQFKILWADDSSSPPHWIIREHAHSYFHLFYVVEGKTVFRADRTPVPVEPNTCLLFPPGMVHGMDPLNAEKIRMIEFKFTVDDPALLARIGSREWCIHGDNFLDTGIRYITNSWLSSDEEEIRTAEVYLHAIILYITSCGTSLLNRSKPRFYDSQSKTLHQRVITYVEQNYRMPVTLATVSKELGYNSSYLSSAFSAAAGCTITDYINLVRIRKAATLLFYNDTDIRYVSDNVGFHNVSYFNRCFKSIIGMAPGRFRDLLHTPENLVNEQVLRAAEQAFIFACGKAEDSIARLRALTAALVGADASADASG